MFQKLITKITIASNIGYFEPNKLLTFSPIIAKVDLDYDATTTQTYLFKILQDREDDENTQTYPKREH